MISIGSINLAQQREEGKGRDRDERDTSSYAENT